MNPCRTPWQQKWLGLDVYHPQIQVLADDVQAYCRAYMNNNRQRPLLVVAVDPGTAKTRVLQAIYRWSRGVGASEAWGKTPTGLYVPWPKAVAGFYKGYDGAVDDYKEADLWIGDDIGAEEDPFRKGMNVLCQILTHRESRHMFTVVSTNIRPEHWQQCFDQRVADRLFSGSRIVDLFGVPSYRQR